MKLTTIKGTITALVTPFNQDGSIDYPSLDGLIDFQIENKIDGILVCGTTGESPTLSFQEKTDVITHSVEYAAGRVPIIAGTGSNDTKGSVKLTKVAKERGADAALIVTPYYNKPTQDGLFEHFRFIADSVDMPQILYNVPGRTATNVAAETQLRVAEECKNVIATKEASGNIAQMAEIIHHKPEGFELMSGDDLLTLPIISIGGNGVISVVSNIMPAKFKKLTDLALEGKYYQARKIHYEMLDIMNTNFIESNPIPVKGALAAMGMIKEEYRMPMFPLKTKNKEIVRAALKKEGLI
ncbi:MAG: 4-hydroxy-tetrahydrodipicolinate synthase [Candidatus Kapabacteria bacterium]|jgi:4-hydroxy-tetrahydrodipicolinate synthase|nr:4-hydroxy-tetrahydrodipicolinate synthase [Candidatus Kapabacteria bacterium]